VDVTFIFYVLKGCRFFQPRERDRIFSVKRRLDILAVLSVIAIALLTCGYFGQYGIQYDQYRSAGSNSSYAANILVLDDGRLRFDRVNRLLPGSSIGDYSQTKFISRTWPTQQPNLQDGCWGLTLA